MARVIVGAVLSVSDLATDFIVLLQFWDGGEKMLAYRNSQLASLATSIVLQLIVVLGQNRKKGILRILKEMAYVFTGLKAPLDAYRVASGAEQEKDTAVDPMTEMMYTKVVEMFSESVPGVIIQTSAILSTIRSGEIVSTAAYLSLLSSLLTTGFVSVTISYDMDAAPKKRAAKPDFYGFVPDSSNRRALMFVTMVLMSGIMVLMKSVFLVSLGSLGINYAWTYLAGDMLIYFVQKVLRRDFVYFLPIKERRLSLVVSALNRVVVKVVIDFTGCSHFRHPYEAARLYFTLNYFQPVLGMIVLLQLTEDGAFGNTAELYLKNVSMCGGACLLGLFSTLWLLIENQYRRTFFSSETGGQLTRRMFLGGDDKMRSEVFGCSETHWAPIREKVKGWVRPGWKTWEEEKPEWFTDEFRASVPSEMIPKKRVGEPKKDDDGEDIDVASSTSFRNSEEAVFERGGGRRKSLIDQMLQGKGESAKIMPEGTARKQIDVEDFKWELRSLRRGSSVRIGA